MKFAIYLLIGIILASCSKVTSNEPGLDPAVNSPQMPMSPPLMGDEVGNGGDYIRVLMEEGRLFAANVVSRIRDDAFPSNIREYLNEDEFNWLKENRKAIEEDIRKSIFVWVKELPEKCLKDESGCAFLGDRKIYFNQIQVEATITRRQDAAKLILHESLHHFVDDNESKAKRFGTAITSTWYGMGHPDSPHWVPLVNPEPFMEKVSSGYLGMVWSGIEMIVLYAGRDDFAGDIFFYNPTTSSWRKQIPENSRDIWKSTELGGSRTIDYVGWINGKVVIYGHFWNTSRIVLGLTYDPKANRWEIIKPNELFSPRFDATFISDDENLVAWGGSTASPNSTEYSNPMDNGAIWNARKETWSLLPPCKLIAQRLKPTILLVNDKLLIWGGTEPISESRKVKLPSYGAIVDLKKNTCSEITALGAPKGRFAHKAFWTGKYMLIYGGFNYTADHQHVEEFLANGGLYDPTTNTWKEMNDQNVPVPVGDYGSKNILSHWTGSNLIVVGKTLSFYNLEKNVWETEQVLNPSRFTGEEPTIWTGFELLYWQGNWEEGFALFP